MKIEQIIDEVYIVNESGCIFPLSKKQSCNIAKQLLTYDIQSEEVFRTALEYITKERAEILLYTNHITPPYKPNFKYYCTIKYPIVRVLNAMGVIDEEISDTFSSSLDENLRMYEFELKNRLRVNIKALTNN